MHCPSFFIWFLAAAFHAIPLYYARIRSAMIKEQISSLNQDFNKIFGMLLAAWNDKSVE
jgi:hypothetical protein